MIARRAAQTLLVLLFAPLWALAQTVTGTPGVYYPDAVWQHKTPAEAGSKHKYVTASPCVNLPELDDEHERERVLSADEIKVLWWGLDRPDLPCSRSIALALKFELVTMLRTKEFLTGKMSEIVGLGSEDLADGFNGRLGVPRHSRHHRDDPGRRWKHRRDWV